jgi:hypothetical protein
MTIHSLVLVRRVLFCPVFRLYGSSLVVPRRGGCIARLSRRNCPLFPRIGEVFFFLPVSLLRECQYFYSLCVFIVVEPQKGTSLVLQDWAECCILLHELSSEDRSFAVHVNSQHHFDRCRKM